MTTPDERTATSTRSWLELRVPPLMLVVAAALAAWSLSNVGPVLIPSRTLRGALAVVLLVAGLAVALAGVVEFRRARTTVDPLQPEKVSGMATSGIYRRTRNPMYVGMALVVAACAAWSGSALAWLLVPVFTSYLTRYQIEPEERVLADRFPEAFGRYRSAVRRWL